MGGASTGLSIANQDEVSHAVVVEIDHISDSPDPIYAAGRTVGAESTVDIEDFDGQGAYEVDVTVDGTTTTISHSFESDASPVTVGIDNEGVVTVGT